MRTRQTRRLKSTRPGSVGPHPPPNTVYYLVFNLPWLIAPMILAARILLGKDLPSMSNARGT